MEKLDVVVGKPSSQTEASVAKGPMARFREHWDLLAIVLLALISTPLPWLSPRTLIVVTHPGAFDYNWVLDSAFKASRGIWFGPGVIFQYGPLFQWIWTAPARWIGLSMGTVYATWKDTSLLWLSLVLLYLTLRLLIPEQPAWKRFLLLLLLPVFWAPWDGRTILNIFLFVVFLRGWYGVREEQFKPVVLGCAAALLCAAAFLYSADAGIYAIAAWLIALAGVAWEGRWEPQAFRRYAFALLAFAVLSVALVFAINAAMTTALDFRYWRSSLAIVNLHRWKEPAPMTEDGEIRLLVTLIVGGIIFLLRRVVPGKAEITARTGFLLGAFAFAVLAMQTGLVRSDDQHIVFAIFAAEREGAAWASAELHELGSLAASAAVQEHARLANEHPPVLRSHDARGNRIDEVEFHPAWHALMSTAVAHGLHGAAWADQSPGAHVARAAKFYIWAQAEAGHGCPISMTYAAIPALRQEARLADRFEPLLAAREYDPGPRPPADKAGLLAGMAMTEKQGGSDVRANTTRGEPAPAEGDGAHLITGHKWFCSAPMCDLFLVLAQGPGGLTCFLLPRVRPDGSRNAMRIQRLKDKLGNRSNASAEVEFDEALAWQVGAAGRGIPTIIEMVNATRLDCVLGSAAAMRQGCVAAVHHASWRQAFGQDLVAQPLMAAVLADLVVESEASTTLALRLAGAAERASRGDAQEAALLRVALPAAHPI